MKLTGAAGQAVQHQMYDAGGTILSSTAPQLILPRAFLGRSHFVVMNLSPTYAMYLEIGSARAVATVSNGAVTGITVTNPGFGFSLPPIVQFRGGGAAGYQGWVGSVEPNSPSPGRPAVAHCVMSGTAPNQTIASIVIDNPGAGYLVAPYVWIRNADQDPGGCADPSYGGGMGLLLPANGGSYYVNGTACTTDPLALYSSGGLGARYSLKWMD